MAKKPDTRSEDVKRITRSKLYKEIEKDLRDQLEANGTFGKFFDDMISDYMAMYVTKTLLVEDIQKRGTIVPYNNGGGQSGYKKNEAVDMFNKTNAQMLKLLSELGLKANAAIGGGDYGDELKRYTRTCRLYKNGRKRRQKRVQKSIKMAKKTH